MRQRFVVTIETDGLDGPKDMNGIAETIQKAIPDLVRRFVHEINPPEVRWEPPKIAKRVQTKG